MEGIEVLPVRFPSSARIAFPSSSSSHSITFIEPDVGLGVEGLGFGGLGFGVLVVWGRGVWVVRIWFQFQTLNIKN